MPRLEPPEEVRAIRRELKKLLDTTDENGKRIGTCKCGVYAFYDYDGEPIYVGQTYERVSSRIARHLTNQRTDAVAMNVLDVFEVAEVEIWPLWHATDLDKGERKQLLDSAEYTVFQEAIEASEFGAVLNEVEVAKAPLAKLPTSFRRRIVPQHVYDRRRHPDLRVARRAATIAKLAQVISERSVGPGLRMTLLTQARRLEHLAKRRFDETGQGSNT